MMLQRHLLVHQGLKPFNCNICSYSTSMKDLLEIHTRKHSVLKIFECDICDYSCIDPPALANHYRTHGVDKPHKCGMCDYAADNLTSLISHSRTHTNERPYKCTSCDKSFSTNSALHDHSFSHKCGQTKQCTFCDFSAPTRKRLKAHLKTHTNEHHYCCKMCGRKFASYSGMYYHIRTHTGEKPHMCKQCGFSSAHPSSFKRHMWVVHKVSVKVTYEDSTFIRSASKTERDLDLEQIPEHNEEGTSSFETEARTASNKSVISKLGVRPEDHKIIRNSRTKVRAAVASVEKLREAPTSSPKVQRKTFNRPECRKTSSAMTYTCDFCGHTCDAAMKLLEHLRHHTGQPIYRCHLKDCNFKSGNLERLIVHKKSHDNNSFIPMYISNP